MSLKKNTDTLPNREISLRPGLLILTGSAAPPDTKEMAHSGTGRIARVTMRPMSLWESGESNGSVSLGGLLTGKEFTSVESPDHRLEDVAFMVCRGGWPQAVQQTGEIALDRANDYYEAVVVSDVSRVDGVSRAPSRVHRLMWGQSVITATRMDLNVMPSYICVMEHPV